MPYVDKNTRKKIESDVHDIIHIKDLRFPQATIEKVLEESSPILEILSNRIETEGDLNYTITRLCHLFLKKKGEKYSVYNTIIGALECAKLELYRRKIAKYEAKKIEENGDLDE